MNCRTLIESRIRRGLLTLAAVCCPWVLPLGASGGLSNSLLDTSADGQLLACANRDSGTVTVVDRQRREKLREIPVGRHPEGVSFIGPTHRLAVAVYDDDRVTIVDADQGTVVGQIDVLDEPYGVVSNRDGSRLFVSLEYPGQVVEIETAALRIVRTIEAGSFVRGIALAPDEQRLYVTEYRTTLVKAFDLASGAAVDAWPGISTDNLARQLVHHPRRPKIYLPHIRSKVTVAQGEGSIFPYVTILDTRPSDGRRRTRVPMDAFLGNLVTANPWEAAIAPDGQQLYVVFGGTDDLFACQVVDDDYREITYRGYARLGRNPRAVCVSPDSRELYVYHALDFEIAVYDAATLKPVAQIPVCDNPLGDEVLRGKVLFYSALQPMVGRRWISCASCHPDGQPDGRTWRNPEGLRNTQALTGLAWTHPIHWSADRDEVQDFEHTIRGPLMQGRGLTAGPLLTELGAAGAGLSADLDALAAYTNSHTFTLSPHAKSGLSESARRGREVFHTAKTQCATCHLGPFYCDSMPRPIPQIVRHDVGTGQDDPEEQMGPAYDTPTLLGVYRTAPYLHHGRAATLRDVLTTSNVGDRHGTTSHLTDQELDDLVAFLQSLPYEDPLPAARQAQLPEVR